jgi:hypothetical protein
MKPGAWISGPLFAVVVLVFFFTDLNIRLKTTVEQLTGGGFLGVAVFVLVVIVAGAVLWGVLEHVLGSPVRPKR